MKTDSVGSRIRFIRIQKKLTLDQLAKKSGISKSFLWEVENDRSKISGEKLLRVVDAFGASLDYILRGESTEADSQPSVIEIPVELGRVAEELGLTYQQTLALLEIDNSIMARRSSKGYQTKSKEYWQELYESVKQFLER
jgi:transcriptional regulator with XRE-family HTH domain